MGGRAMVNIERRSVEKHFIWKKVLGELSINRTLYLMAIPVLLYFIIFCYIPMGGLVIAFKKYDLAKGIFGSEWVGLKHFKDYFTGIYFGRTMRNTLLISFYNILFGFPAPVIFAILLNELRSKWF